MVREQNDQARREAGGGGDISWASSSTGKELDKKEN